MENQEMVLDVSGIKSAVLLRIIEEVRNDKRSGVTAYDRLHNRHNRGGGGYNQPSHPRPVVQPIPPSEPVDTEK